MNFLSRNRVIFEIRLFNPARPRLIFNPFHVPSSPPRRTMSSSLEQKLTELQKYSACDVSDALLKLQKPPAGTAARAGHLADFSKEPHSEAEAPISILTVPSSISKANSSTSPLLPHHRPQRNTTQNHRSSINFQVHLQGQRPHRTKCGT
jgi:hypothetical protein